MKRPLLLGHRGCLLPGFQENTEPAFEFALSKGCDGVEFDVRYTRDDRFVICHDYFWNRQPIASKDYRDLVDANGDHPPSLEDALQHFGRRAFLDIELKVDGDERAVVAAIHACPPQRGFMLTSFQPTILLRLRNNDDQLPLGYICERDYALRNWDSLPVQTILPRQDLVTPELIGHVHARGMQIMTWTVNDPSRMRKLAAQGIDGIISDDPGLLYQTFHST